MRNIALKLMYNGTAYHGWQMQRTEASVQETLQRGLSMVCGERVRLTGVGRTDAGVHAERYVANFRTSSRIPIDRLPFAVNTHTPEDIVVREALPAPWGGVLVLGILLSVWANDSFAYLVGSKFGKHKLAPVVSPNKTVEGAIGGVIGSVVIGLLATIIYSALSGRFASLTVAVTARHYIIIAAMGAVASVLGILGDLFASAVKRQVGIKDYGTIFPGHGGILDRFDSVMFIAPLVSIVVRYFFYVFQ